MKISIVQDRDNPARQPFTLGLDRNWTGTAQINPFYIVVPTGKRLVIEQVSVDARLTPSATQKLIVQVFTKTGSNICIYSFIGTDVGGAAGLERFIASSQMRCYADPDPTQNYIGVHRSDTNGGKSDNAMVFLSGYLVDVP